MPNVNKVVYGNDTLIDLTSDDVTASDVKSGKTFHDASGMVQSGSMIITDITPNSYEAPISMTANNMYKPTINSYAIRTYKDTKPSNSSPVRLVDHSMHRIIGNNIGGYAIEYYYDITPSSTPISVSTNEIILSHGNGVIVDAIPTPTGDKDLGTINTNGSKTGYDVAGYATASFTVNVPSGIPSMTLKESARWNGATTSVSLTAGNYFFLLESESTGTPSISISGVTTTNVIAVPRASSSTSRSLYAWTFTLSETKSVSITGSGFTNRYIFTYS